MIVVSRILVYKDSNNDRRILSFHTLNLVMNKFVFLVILTHSLVRLINMQRITLFVFIVFSLVLVIILVHVLLPLMMMIIIFH